MPISRRQALALTSSALLFPTALFANRLDTGAGELVTLSDGSLTLPLDFVFGDAPQDLLAAEAAAFGVQLGDTITQPFNATLLRRGNRIILFDVGSGNSFEASAGHLPAALIAEGVDPGDVTDVVFTHLHPDHFWGVFNDEGNPVFPNAVHRVNQLEHAFWMDPDTALSIGELRAAMAVGEGTRQRLEQLAPMLETFADGDEIAPGVTAMMTPGHTAGHTSFEIDGPSNPALVVGDAIGIGYDGVVFSNPDWPISPDHDIETGIQTRTRLIDRLAHEQLTAIFVHVAQGGIGHVERVGDGYQFVPVV